MQGFFISVLIFKLYVMLSAHCALLRSSTFLTITYGFFGILNFSSAILGVFRRFSAFSGVSRRFPAFFSVPRRSSIFLCVFWHFPAFSGVIWLCSASPEYHLHDIIISFPHFRGKFVNLLNYRALL